MLFAEMLENTPRMSETRNQTEEEKDINGDLQGWSARQESAMKRLAVDVPGGPRRRRKSTQGPGGLPSLEISTNELSLRRAQRAFERTAIERVVVLSVKKYADESVFETALSG